MAAGPRHGDAAWDAQSAGTPQPDRHRSEFVGRDRALDLLDASLGVATGGQFSGVLVSGPAGMGKTRLVEEFRARAAGRIGRVAVGACLDESGAVMALHPILQIVEALGGEFDPADGGGRSLEQNFRTMVGILARAAATSPPLLVVIDDLHWADATTLAFVQFAARSLADESIMFIGTHRDGPDVVPRLRRLLTALDRHPRLQRLPLAPLDPDAMARLVQVRVGAVVDDATMHDLVMRAEGVTFFMEELAGELTRGTTGVPARVRDVFLDAVDRLDLGTREVLDMAAVCGPAFSHELLVRVADLPRPTVDKRVDELMDAALLVVDGRGDGYRFRHTLLHETVRSQLRPASARRLHASCARAIQADPTLAPGGSAASALARHWRAAGQPGPALAATLEAVGDATAQDAHAEAVALALDAVDLLPMADVASDVTMGGLLALAAASADRSGDHAGAAELFDRAIGVTPDDDPCVANLYVELIRAQYLAGNLGGAVHAAVRGTAVVSASAPAGGRATLLALASPFVVLHDGDIAKVFEHTQTAMTIARELGDPDVLCDVLSCHGLALARVGQPGPARSALSEARILAAGVADPRRSLRPAIFELSMLHAAGASGEVAEVGRRDLARAIELGVDHSVGQQLRSLVADALIALGSWVQAREIIEDGLAWGAEPLAGALLLVDRIELALRRGRTAEAERDLQVVRAHWPEGHYRLARVEAELAWLHRDVSASRAHAARALALGGVVATDDEIGSLSDAVIRASAAADGPDDGIPRAEELQAALAERAGHPVVDAWHATVTARSLGAGAADAWAAAAVAWRSLGRIPMLAESLWHQGVAKVATGEVGEAIAVLREAEELALQLDFVPLLIEVRATMSSLTAAQQAQAVDGRMRDGMADQAVVESHSTTDQAGEGGPPAAAAIARDLDITERQVEVLRLIALGWTNRRIGQELGISPRTVGVHVSRILARLGVGTRGEAAAILRSRGEG